MKKMEDIMKKKMRESTDKVIRIVQQNNFIYKGKVVDFDDSCVEFLDFKDNKIHVIRFDYIKHLELLE